MCLWSNNAQCLIPVVMYQCHVWNGVFVCKSQEKARYHYCYNIYSRLWWHCEWFVRSYLQETLSSFPSRSHQYLRGNDLRLAVICESRDTVLWQRESPLASRQLKEIDTDAMGSVVFHLIFPRSRYRESSNILDDLCVIAVMLVDTFVFEMRLLVKVDNTCDPQTKTNPHWNGHKNITHKNLILTSLPDLSLGSEDI